MIKKRFACLLPSARNHYKLDLTPSVNGAIDDNIIGNLTLYGTFGRNISISGIWICWNEFNTKINLPRDESYFGWHADINDNLMKMVLTKLQWGVKLQCATSFMALLTRSYVLASFPARCYKEGMNSPANLKHLILTT